MRHSNQQGPLVTVNSFGWTGKQPPTTKGTEGLHAEIMRENVRLMQGGLLAKRLGIKGDFKNPFPNGHQGVSTRRMLDLYVHDPINEMEKVE